MLVKRINKFEYMLERPSMMSNMYSSEANGFIFDYYDKLVYPVELDYAVICQTWTESSIEDIAIDFGINDYEVEEYLSSHTLWHRLNNDNIIYKEF